MDTSSSRLILGLPLHLVAYSFPYSIFFGIAVSCTLSICPSHHILWHLINLTMFSPLIIAPNSSFCWVLHNSFSLSILYVPRLVVGFRNNYFLQGEVVSLTPNPQRGGPGYPLLSGPSPSTCPARVALPVAVATAGIALRIIWPRKPSHLALAFCCYRWHSS